MQHLQQDYNFLIFQMCLLYSRPQNGKRWWCTKQTLARCVFYLIRLKLRKSWRSLCLLALLSSAYRSYPTITGYDLVLTVTRQWHFPQALTSTSCHSISYIPVAQMCHEWWGNHQGGSTEFSSLDGFLQKLNLTQSISGSLSLTSFASNRGQEKTTGVCAWQQLAVGMCAQLNRFYTAGKMHSKLCRNVYFVMKNIGYINLAIISLVLRLICSRCFKCQPYYYWFDTAI